jgi:hypothetical protein
MTETTVQETRVTQPAAGKDAPLVVEDVTMAFGDFVVQRDLNFRSWSRT